MEHVMLFGDIAKNMMFDGWIAVGICVLMVVVGWWVAFKKFKYLNSVQHANEAFLKQWSEVSTDLTVIDHGDRKSVASFGGRTSPEMQKLIEKSSIYDIYHIGSEEIRHRLEQDRTRKKGLTGRSIQAIRAALDAGLVRENHKLTDGLIYLTISIAGGPYIGLLGTVVGVMITFAVIAKSGEVDVNSIAPGIASALLATVAGLIVAIPALFMYSYLNSRIKSIVSEMQVFIDEFVAKMAEFYQGSDNPNTASNDTH
jgi:biopolymer transport protein ExbB